MRVALVHDYLTQQGGAERVLDVLHQRFPEAPVFTALFDPDELAATVMEYDVRTSVLNRVPGAAQRHRLFTPFYPLAFRQLSHGLQGFDLVIADSSAWAHHLDLRPEQTLICYCHSPARFLYGDADYLNAAKLAGPARIAINLASSGLKRLDKRAARRVDRYLANSRNVADRISREYGRKARIVYPPIDIERFRPDPSVEPECWYLIVSRLVPHKWIQLAVEACTKARLPLKIAGDGRARSELEAMAGPTVEFLGQRGDEDVIALMRRCRALLLPGAEDFGMTAVEAQAVGRPVIAYAKGGALESVIDGETGLFFSEQSADSLLAAINRFGGRTWDPASARANAERFSVSRFLRELDEEVERGLNARKNAASKP